MNWKSKITASHNPKVIVMLSGGKDSIASIIMLKSSGIDVSAVHFVHKWGSTIPTQEAKRICAQFSIPLTIVDYTKEFCNAVNGYQAGRPCLLCKKQMYKVLLSMISKCEYGWLCIGDTANDRTTIARIRQYIEFGHPEDCLECSGYFGSEMGIQLPESMKVIRPLIEMTSDDVESFLSDNGIHVQRINSTGDKYFEYHREGCPIQFADVGVSLNENLYRDLKKYNDCITEFARSEGILASVHMPSTFIVTIPRGYEKKAAMYLQEHGLKVDTIRNSNRIPEFHMIGAIIYEFDEKMWTLCTQKKVFNRLLERLELCNGEQVAFEKSFISEHTYSEKGVSLYLCFDYINNSISLQCYYEGKHQIAEFDALIENLIIELFRTRKYKIFVQ